MMLLPARSPAARRTSGRDRHAVPGLGVALALMLIATGAAARGDSSGAPVAMIPAAAGAVAAGPAEAGRYDPGVLRARLVVQPRETLDAVIRRTHRGSPFRDDILRRAFVQLNPAAFERGSPHALLAGAELLVPTVADVLALAGVALPRPPEPEARPLRDSADEMRQWVRYP